MTTTQPDLDRELADARTALLYAQLQQAALPRDETRRHAVHEAQRRVVAAMKARLEARG